MRLHSLEISPKLSAPPSLMATASTDAPTARLTVPMFRLHSFAVGKIRIVSTIPTCSIVKNLLCRQTILPELSSPALPVSLMLKYGLTGYSGWHRKRAVAEAPETPTSTARRDHHGYGQHGRRLHDDSRKQWPTDGPPHSSSAPPPFICNWGDLDCLGPGLGPKKHEDSDIQHRQDFVVPPDDFMFARLAIFF
jgi:hypothetical protein